MKKARKIQPKFNSKIKLVKINLRFKTNYETSTGSKL